MDLADDIAYSSFDVIDGWKARFLAADKLEAWGGENARDDVQNAYLRDLINFMFKGTLQPKMNGLIGELIQGASLKKTSNFLTGKTRRHAFSVVVNPIAQTRIALHKTLCRELVYGSSALKQIEYKGQQILGKLAHRVSG